VVVPPSRTRSAYEWIERSRLTEAEWLLECLSRSEGETLF
jgi:hypothetical protein